MRFSICVIEPASYKYTHFLYDLCKYLCFSIESTGHECCILRNQLSTDRTNIIVGAHTATDPSIVDEIRQAGPYIVLHTEIITGNSIWSAKKSFSEVCLPLMRQASVVWTGVKQNIAALKDLDINADQITWGYHPLMEEIHHKEIKDIDFLFCGSITPHRKNLIDQLIAHGAKVVTVFDDAAMYRNDLIARSRVNLAPNQGPGMNHLGGGRVLYLVNNHSIVVVERCHDQDLYEHCFPSADTDQWVDLCMETLRRPDLREVTEEYYERFRQIRMADLIEPLLDAVFSGINSCAPLTTHLEPNVLQDKGRGGVCQDDAPITEMADRTFMENMASIIIVTQDHLDQTKRCIKNIRNHTPEPYEIIFVDNGSADGTSKWLRSQVATYENCRLIEAKEDVGRVKAKNLGISASQGEFIVMMDDDAVVKAGWLESMLHCLRAAPRAGIVGPRPRDRHGVHLEADMGMGPDGLNEFAVRHKEQYRYQRIPSRNLDGFCLLFKRELVQKIGLLDEQFDAGRFEDDDLCLRSAVAGFSNYVAGGALVGRDNTCDQTELGSDWAPSMKIFDEKWTGVDLRTSLGKRLFALERIHKSETLNQKGDLDQAIAVIIDGIKHAPEETDLYYHLAEMLLDAKLYRDALDAVDSLPLGEKVDPRYLELVARCEFGLGESGDCIDRLTAADKDSPTALNLKGMEAYRRGDHGAAEDFLKQAIAADPGYASPYTNLGMLTWASGKDEEALDYLEKGFILSPTATEHVELYHSAVTETGQFARAEGFVRDAVTLYPESKRVLFFLIDLLIKQGKFSVAMDHIEKAMLTVGVDDGMLAAALEIRNRVGTKDIAKASRGKGTLSLCMIVKNEEQHLARCLLSVKSVVDEMIVVDTGSTDRTGDIAKAFGAKVFDFPWSNDFSAARNHSLSMAAGDWILVLDADEVISELDHPALRSIVKKKHSKPGAYAMVTRNYTNEAATRGWTANDRKYRKEEAGTGWFPSKKVRLFPNNKNIRFQNPVHELVEASVKERGLEIRHADIPVHHYGRFDKDKLLMKGKEYFLLGMRKLEELKGDTRALRELAIQASELKEYETAVDLWKKVIERDPNDAGAYLNISYAYLKLEKYQEGLISSRRATELDPDMKEAALNYADAEFIIGDVGNTISVLEKVLQKDPDYPPAIALLAAALYTTGQRDAGSSLFERLRKKGFHCAEFLHLHCEGAISQGREDQAIMLLQAAVDSGFITEDTQKLLNQCKGATHALTSEGPVNLGTAVSQASIPGQI